MAKKRNTLLAVGIVLAVLLVCGVFGFVKKHTAHLPTDADMIVIRSGLTGKRFEISRETDPDVFDQLSFIELSKADFEPFASLRMGHIYILEYYKDGEVVTQLMGKGGAYQTYRFPFFYYTTVDIEKIIEKYIQNTASAAL